MEGHGTVSSQDRREIFSDCTSRKRSQILQLRRALRCKKQERRNTREGAMMQAAPPSAEGERQPNVHECQWSLSMLVGVALLGGDDGRRRNEK